MTRARGSFQPTAGARGGYLPDPAGHRYNGFHLLRASRLSIGDGASIDQFAPPTPDQGGTGSCTGHGTRGFVTTTLAAQGWPLPAPICARTTYANGRAIDRLPNSDGSFDPLTDEGAAPNRVARAAARYGLVLESETDGSMPVTDPNYTAYLEAHVNDEPRLGELESAHDRVVVGFNAITATGQDKVTQFCQAINGGHAIGAGVAAGDPGFQGYRGGVPLGFTGTDFDHWIYFSAWKQTPNGKLFLLKNSWGLGNWTPDGTAWMTEDGIIRGTDGPLVCDQEG